MREKRNRLLGLLAAGVLSAGVLLETDSPYLPPVPFRGQRNDSSKLRYIAEKAAEIKGLSPEMLAEITCENAKRLFGI